MTRPHRPIVDTLRELSKGRVLDELGINMAELVHAVRDSGKPGSLLLKLTVKPASRGQTTAVMVGADIQLKRPKVERGEDVFFTTADDALVKQDPNQGELPLTLVPVGGKPVANALNVDAATGEVMQ